MLYPPKYRYKIVETGDELRLAYKPSEVFSIGPTHYTTREVLRNFCCKSAKLEKYKDFYPINYILIPDKAVIQEIEEAYEKSANHLGWLVWTREPGRFVFDRIHQFTLECTEVENVSSPSE